MRKKGLDGVKYWFNHIEEVVLVAMLAVMVVLVFLQIVSRYVFNSSLTWTEELARYMFAWLSWVGVSLAAREGKHITIDAVANLFAGKKTYVIINIIAEVIVIGICGVLVKEGITLTTKMYMIKSVSPMLKIPMGVCYLSVVVGCALLIIRTVGQIMTWVKRWRAGIYTEEEG